MSSPKGDYLQSPCPVLQTEIWQSLKSAEQKQLMKGGLLKIEPQ